VLFDFRPMAKASALVIVHWRYSTPYDIYNLDSGDVGETIEALLDPQFHYHIMTDQQEGLVAYCCFGKDGQVPGGDYSLDALDIGLGVRPDLTGQGRGLSFVGAVLDFACQTYSAQAFRVTVAQFNRRALRVWEQAGFRPVQTFERHGDGLPFVVLTYELGKDRLGC
jgi:ribosomal-protein-alanine N-acetyltransferase